MNKIIFTFLLSISSVVVSAQSLDRDGDGVVDIQDRCPNEKGPYSNGGCPLPGLSAEAKKNTDSIFNTATVKPFITVWEVPDGLKNFIHFKGKGSNYLIRWIEVGNPSNEGETIATNNWYPDFKKSGTYEVKVYPGKDNFWGYGNYQMNYESQKHFSDSYLVEIKQWGDVNWTVLQNAFEAYPRVRVTAIDAPKLDKVTSLEKMFSRCDFFDGNPSFNNWDVSKVQTFSKMFADCKDFNQPLGKWNMSNADYLDGMFNGAEKFNQNIENWNTAKVYNTDHMFTGAKSFNQPLNKWNVSNVKFMRGMFRGAESFNQPLNAWNVSKVDVMTFMFEDAKSFNQPLDKWNVSNVKEMASMFLNASAFNQPLAKWNVSKVTNMTSMFRNATAFNQNLTTWNISSLQSSYKIFDGTAITKQNMHSKLVEIDKQNETDIAQNNEEYKRRTEANKRSKEEADAKRKAERGAKNCRYNIVEAANNLKHSLKSLGSGLNDVQLIQMRMPDAYQKTKKLETEFSNCSTLDAKAKNETQKAINAIYKLYEIIADDIKKHGRLIDEKFLRDEVQATSELMDSIMDIYKVQ
jgi:surface protein